MGGPLSRLPTMRSKRQKRVAKKWMAHSEKNLAKMEQALHLIEPLMGFKSGTIERSAADVITSRAGYALIMIGRVERKKTEGFSCYSGPLGNKFFGMLGFPGINKKRFSGKEFKKISEHLPAFVSGTLKMASAFRREFDRTGKITVYPPSEKRGMRPSAGAFVGVEGIKTAALKEKKKENKKKAA